MQGNVESQTNMNRTKMHKVLNTTGIRSSFGKPVNHHPSNTSDAPNSRLVAILGAMVAIAVVSGCASVGDQGTRASMRPSASLGLTSASATPTSSIAWPRDEWWKQYDDAVLNDLIAQALAQNPTLKIAETRIRRAEGEAGVINAQSRVQINGAVDSTYERFSKMA